VTTAADLIKLSLSDLSRRGAGETPSDDDYADCLATLNAMLDSWSADGIVIPYHTVDTLTLAASASSYTIGSGATLDTARPVEIMTALIRRGGHDYPMGTMTRRQYDALADKTAEAIPGRYYFEPAYPLSTIYFESRPSVDDILEIASIKPLSAFATTATDISLPEGYERALRFNLAIDIAGMYGLGNKIPQTVVKGAQDSLGKISKRNFINRIPTLEVDNALRAGSRYNINTD